MNHQDMDELLAESTANIPQDFSLDDLLAESVALAKDAKADKDAKARLAKGGLSPKEREADMARLAAWEMKHVWKPEANVARFLETSCANCGECSYVFTGLLQRQSHRHAPAQNRRWVAVDAQDPKLPNETMIKEEQSAFCGECSAQFGFTWKAGYYEDGREWEAAAEEEEVLPVPGTIEFISHGTDTGRFIPTAGQSALYITEQEPQS
jgi:hypothetical protein